MKRIEPFIAIILLMAASCTERIQWREDSTTALDGKLSERIYTISYPQTRADIDESLGIVWEVGDELSVYDPIEDVGRKFTVISISSGEATIKGTISCGDFDFSAVYPYDVVSSWDDAQTPVIDIPMEQIIPSGRSVDKRALICGAFSVAQGQDIRMESLYSLVKFTIPQDDVTKVSISVSPQKGAEAETYTVTAEGGTFSEGCFFALVKPGEYKGGITMKGNTLFDIDWTRSSGNSFVIGSGESINLGSIRDGQKYVHYTHTGQITVSSISELAKGSRYYEMLADEMGKTTLDIILTAAITYYFFSTQYDDVYAFNYNFTTAGIDGRPMTQSARLYIPKKAFSKGEKLKGLALGSRATIIRNEECPTMRHQIEGMTAWKGYAVVMPDFYGFGADNHHYQAFINAPLIGRNNIDAVQAAQQIIDDFELSHEDKTINMGYSQGGMAAFASLKYAIDHPEAGINFDKTFAGGGPYNFNNCYDAYMTGEYPIASRFIYLSIASLNESESMGLDYSKLYKGAMLDNYHEWLLSKKYDIIALLNFIGESTIYDFLHEDIILKRGEESKKMIDMMEKYSLVKDNTTIPESSELFLFHSTVDDYVPFVNYSDLKEKLSGNGIHFCEDDYGDHFTAALDFAKIILEEL